jgi:hypothetical protein
LGSCGIEGSEEVGWTCLLFRLPSSAFFSWKECQQLMNKDITTIRTLGCGVGGSEDIGWARLLFRLPSSALFS